MDGKTAVWRYGCAGLTPVTEWLCWLQGYERMVVLAGMREWL